MRILTAVLCAATLLPVTAFADTYTYTYTGFPYATAGGAYGDQVTGSLTLASPLVVNNSGPLIPVTPLSFSFSDGLQSQPLTNTSPNLSLATFAFSTQGNGIPSLWAVDIVQNLQDGGVNQIIVALHPGGGFGDQAYYDYIAGSSQGGLAFSSRPGNWTVTDNTGPVDARTPEPGSLVLAATGLLTLAGGLRARALTP